MLKKIGMLVYVSASFSILMAMLWVSPVLSADFQKGLDAYNKEDYSTAFKEWKSLAEEGDAKAQYFVGILYSIGRGVEKNDKQAIYWTRKSAENGYVDAIYSVANSYQKGFGVDKDINESIRWYEKLANKEDVKAQLKLAFLYETELKDFEKAANWYKKAIEKADDNTMYSGLGYDFGDEQKNGKGFALYHLGYLYEKGNGVPLDNSKAIKNYKKAAELGLEDAVSQLAWIHKFTLNDYKEASKWYLKLVNTGDEFAMYHLGELYKKGGNLGQDYQKAFELYKKSSENGYSPANYELATLYKDGNGTPQNYKGALKYYIKAASESNFNRAPAELELGHLYKEGKGVPQDYKQAFEWYKKAAELFSSGKSYNSAFMSDAYFYFALMYEDGLGVKQDYEQAAKWYEKAEELGSPSARNNLAALYASGKGVVQDYKEAFRLYKMLAENGNKLAQFNLGAMYMKGEGVLQDYVQAHVWMNISAANGEEKAQNLRDEIERKMTPAELEKANKIARDWVDSNKGKEIDKNSDYSHKIPMLIRMAEKGDLESQYLLGLIYRKGLGIPRDNKRAIKWFRKPAENGNVDAQKELGFLLSDLKDMKESLKWLKKAAEKGDADSQILVAMIYGGGSGIPKDDKEASIWWRKAALQGKAEAQFQLSQRYRFGVGFPQDTQEAKKWRVKAVENGHIKAQVLHGALYYKGDGVIQNNIYAHMWFNVAASLGSKKAQEFRRLVSEGMTPDDISKAQELARRCVKNNYKKCEQ